MSKEAIVWSLPNCVMCNRTKQWLEKEGVPYTEMDLSAPEHAEDLALFKTSGLAQAPIVEVVDNTDEYGLLNQLDLWSGFNVPKLEEHFSGDIWA